MLDPARIYVVENDASTSRALGRLLRAEGFAPELYRSAGEVIARQELPTPGCLLVELELPDAEGLEVQRALRDRRVDLPAVFTAELGDSEGILRAMRGGAFAVLEKPLVVDELLVALRSALAAHAGERSHSERRRVLGTRLASLTPREREVLELVVCGFLNKQVALELDIAEKTVKVHRGRVMKKMGAGSLAELVQMAQQLGLFGEG
jgi:FixJ family two-component response regulator